MINLSTCPVSMGHLFSSTNTDTFVSWLGQANTPICAGIKATTHLEVSKYLRKKGMGNPKPNTFNPLVSDHILDKFLLMEALAALPKVLR